MRALLTTPGPLRRFLLVSAQSSLGTAMGWVALLLLAYEQYRSPWAVSLVLIVGIAPSALLGSYFGKLADQHSRRRLAIAGDLIRAAAFFGIALSGSFALTLVLAAVAGLGSALFRPSANSAIPALAGERVDSAVPALGALNNAASLVGPAVGALILLVASLDALLLVNAATFVISVVTIAGLPMDRAPLEPAARDGEGPMSLEAALEAESRRDHQRAEDRSIRIGVRAIREVVGLPLLIVATTGATFALALVNVAEPLLVTGPLDGGDAGFSLIIAVFGVGATAGAARSTQHLGRLIVAVVGAGAVMLLIAVVPNFALAVALFTLSGWFEGFTLSSEQRLMTALAPEHVLGRAFGLKDSLDGWALLAAYVASAALASAVGPRWVFAASGIIAIAVGTVALASHARQRESAETIETAETADI